MRQTVKTVKSGILVSAALAGLVLASSCSYLENGEEEPEIVGGECHGINSCKGQGACAGKDHRCAGMNSCKGQGWLKMTEKECLDKKGTYRPLSMEM